MNNPANSSSDQTTTPSFTKVNENGKIYVLGHADSDGRYAMWCAYRHFKNTPLAQNVELHEVQYGQPVPLDASALTKNDTVFILDFSYKADVLTQMAQLVGKLVVLDHHKGAANELLGLHENLQSFGDVLIHFDMSKSGALLAWEYFNPGTEAPYPCLLVNDRDMWSFQYGDETRSLECYIRAFGRPSSMQWWDKLHNEDNEQEEDSEYFLHVMQKGFVCLEYERGVLGKFVRNPRNWKIIPVRVGDQTYKAAVYEGMGVLHSELAEKFYTTKDVDFTLEWRRKEHEKLVFSLRSPTMDVSELARQYGGNGHKAAAGFSMKLEEGFAFVCRLTLSEEIENW